MSDTFERALFSSVSFVNFCSSSWGVLRASPVILGM